MNLVPTFWTDEERPAAREGMTEVNYADQAGGSQGQKWASQQKKGTH